MSSYIIRSMVDNCLSIQPETDESGNVYWKIVEIDADDANVPASQTFYFQFDGNFGGYRIYPYGDSGNMIHYTSDGSVQGEGPTNAASSWSLTKYVGEDKVEHIFTLEDEWIETGALISTSYTGRILGCSTVPNINRFEWSMSDTHGALSYYTVDEFGDLVFEPTKYVQFSISFRFYAGNSETPYKTTVRYFGTSAEGGFFIQNVATEMYIDIDGGITDNGAAATQSKYSAMDSQRWIIQTLPDSGATVVKSALSGNYLGISYDDNILLGVYDYVDDFTIWNVEYEDDGTYTFWFTPTGPDGTTVAVPSNDEGARVMMQTDWELYTENCNKWELRPVLYKRDVSIFYDNGYMLKRGMTSYESWQHIKQLCVSAFKMYWEEFGLHLNIKRIQYFYSAIDRAKDAMEAAGQNVDATTPCACATEEGIISDFEQHMLAYEPSIGMYFSGHSIQVSTGDFNRSFENSGNVYILNNTINSKALKGTIQHEINHVFGVRHHYHVRGSEDENGHCDNFPYCSDCARGLPTCRYGACVMNHSQEDFEVLCDDCREELKLNLASN